MDSPGVSCNGGLGIDLNCHFSGITATQGAPDFVMGYAFTYLIVDSDMDVLIHTGADDGYRFFIDGVMVVDLPNNCRCYGDSQEVTPFHLSAGTHRVLMQVGEAQGHWGFTFSLTNPSGTVIRSGVRSELIRASKYEFVEAPLHGTKRKPMQNLVGDI